MIIGHLPAGYLGGLLFSRRFGTGGNTIRAIILAGVLGGVAPDLDMFYFYLVDQGQHHHHTYWTHFPVVWGSLLILAAVIQRIRPGWRAAAPLLAFSSCGFAHLLLDSIVGDVWWFAPFIDRPYALFTVQPRYSPWWLNFILHWTFALELVLWGLAMVTWRSAPNKPL